MIAQIHGVVIGRDERSLTIDAHGLGYRVFVLPRLITATAPDTEIKLFTHLQVREDSWELYGFDRADDVKLFERLLTVSGVGPRVAMNVMAAAPADDLRQAIDRGNATLLTKVSGVGGKTAERIIVELRGKILTTGDSTDSDLSAVIDALVNLGYSAREAREAAATTPSTLTVSDRIKSALRSLGK
jgi:Holliday junction DNA helicase RuvA